MMDAVFADEALTEGVLMRRVWAWLIDLVVIGVLMAVLWVVLAAFGVLTLGLGLPLLAIVPVVPLCYHALFVAARGATPGQSLLGITVVRDDDLGPPTLLQAILFTAGLWLTLSAGVIWLAATLFLPRKRALHDLVSGLVVIRTQALTRPPVFGTMARG